VPIYYPDILEEAHAPVTFTYAEKDVILYALGVGLGADPLDERELPFVYERDLAVLPTAATVLSSAGRDWDDWRGPKATAAPGRRLSTPDMTMLVHGEQKLELHKPLPARGTFTARSRVTGAFDKGPGKGAVTYNETVWTDPAGEKVLTLTAGLFYRGDGGFGGPAEGAPEPRATPPRAPDITVEIRTRPDQALLYRLNGDRNPLHCDPEFARKVGFPRPILRGLCTYGLTCRAVLQEWCEYDAARIASHELRFSSPVFPGETLSIEMWREAGGVAFQARAAERGVTVVKNGWTALRG
jgi:acyl dehydratase